jgi:DNA/RNA endonuclease YhcR with UshA esterase domain
MGKTIHVSGKITVHKGKSQIEVHDASQISLVEESSIEHEVVPWEKAGEKIGTTVAVTGRVVLAKNIGHLCFLNFTEDFKGKFSVPIFEECFSKWPEPPEKYFKDKAIRVTGNVTLHKNAPQIEVRSAEQIEIIDSAELVQAVTTEQPNLDSLPVISWEKVNDHVGKSVIVEGEVMVTKNIGNICFLNFTEDFKGKFSVPIFEECFSKWPEPPEKYFKDKAIRVTGKT